MEQGFLKPGHFFEELKLHPGDRLQLEIPTPQRDLRYFTTLIGYVRGLSVLVRTPTANNLPMPMREGETVVLRGFSGLDAFSFECTVVRVCQAPFYYLHLSFPKEILTKSLRKEVRVKVKLPVKVTAADSELATHATITNISTAGIQIESEEEFGGKGGEVTVSFRFTIQPNDYEAHLEAGAVIQKVTVRDNPSGDIAFQYGVKLLNLHSSQAILLQNLIYQQLLENHHNLA